MARLKGGSATVTGAARGLGRVTAELFAREGARVYATDVDPPAPDFDKEAVMFALEVPRANGQRPGAGSGRCDIEQSAGN